MKLSPYLFPVAAVLALSACPPSFGDDAGGSLDNLWDEHAGTPAAAPASAPAPTPTPTLNSTGVQESAPMCPLTTLKDSSLVQRGGWPGIGPFKEEASGPFDLVDAANNHLRYHVEDEKVTEAELSIVKDRSGNQDLLDLQMSANFLLEAVGAKAKKIADFNQELEKSKESLLGKNDGRPLNLFAGKYLVSIQRQPGDTASGYLIRVNSRDISKDLIKQHSVSQGGESGAGQGAGGTDGDGKPPTAGGSADGLKEEFLNVVKNWQTVKKSVTRSRQTEKLSECLSGKALALQTNTINWLVTNRKYWDINPKSVLVDKYTEVDPGKRYEVLVQVKQSRKYVDDATGQVLKEANDDDRVKYTVEKIGDKWFITDYAIVSTPGAPQATRPQPGKANR